MPDFPSRQTGNTFQREQIQKYSITNAIWIGGVWLLDWKRRACGAEPMRKSLTNNNNKQRTDRKRTKRDKREKSSSSRLVARSCLIFFFLLRDQLSLMLHFHQKNRRSFVVSDPHRAVRLSLSCHSILRRSTRVIIVDTNNL